MDLVLRAVIHIGPIFSVGVGFWVIFFVCWHGATVTGRVALILLLIGGAFVLSHSSIELAAAVDEMMERAR